MKHSQPTVKETTIKLHKTINWVVSVILLVFAIWSIHLNSQTVGVYKQTVQIATDISADVDTIAKDMNTVRELCQAPTVVVPVPTTDAEKVQ